MVAPSSKQKKSPFFEEHRTEITLYTAAKKYFYERGLKKLPSIKTLQAEWCELEKQRSPLYTKYKAANQKFKDLCAAKSNAHHMFGLDKDRENSRSYAPKFNENLYIPKGSADGEAGFKWRGWVRISPTRRTRRYRKVLTYALLAN